MFYHPSYKDFFSNFFQCGANELIFCFSDFYLLSLTYLFFLVPAHGQGYIWQERRIFHQWMLLQVEWWASSLIYYHHLFLRPHCSFQRMPSHSIKRGRINLVAPPVAMEEACACQIFNLALLGLRRLWPSASLSSTQAQLYHEVKRHRSGIASAPPRNEFAAFAEETSTPKREMCSAQPPAELQLAMSHNAVQHFTCISRSRRHPPGNGLVLAGRICAPGVHTPSIIRCLGVIIVE